MYPSIRHPATSCHARKQHRSAPRLVLAVNAALSAQTVSDMKRAMSQAAFAQEIAILRACRNANILQFQVQGRVLCKLLPGWAAQQA